MRQPIVEADGLAVRQHIWDCVDAFERELREHGSADIEPHLPAEGSAARLTILTEIVRVQLEYAWERGATDELDRLLQRFPEISGCRRSLEAIAFEDFRLRSRHAPPADPAVYAARLSISTSNWHSHALAESDAESHVHGQSATEATASRRALLTAREHQHGDAPDRLHLALLPRAGETFGDFRLESELGQGSFSRVFIARQSGLSDRRVVLKITAAPLGESQRLARLQHACIVPLFSVHQHGGLFALCMPLLGVTTLKDVVDRLQASPRGLARIKTETGEVEPFGRLFVETIRASRARRLSADRAIPGGPDTEVTGGFTADVPLHRFVKMDYVSAVLWIGLQLAEGLAHAHQRGILHHDIKPANILLADDGQPMLLDFNLSRESSPAQARESGALGGTQAYMSPEHSAAMATGLGHVGEPADLYSLGVVLYQLLLAELPTPANAAWPDRIGPEPESRGAAFRFERLQRVALPPSVRSILLKCLAPDPAARYGTAAQLATDLRCQLCHLPLQHAANPSWRERAEKYARRHPRLVSSASLVIASCVMVAILLSVAANWRRIGLEQRATIAWDHFQAAAHVAEAEIIAAEGGSSARGLELGYAALQPYAVLSDPRWLNRPLVQRLAPEDRRLMVEQVAELVQLMRLAAPAEGQVDSDPRADFLAEFSAASANGEQSLIVQGWQLVQNRQFPEALGLIEPALAETPQRFALWFLAGKCHYELRQYDQAEHCFAMASWADPQAAQSYLYRALCHYWLRDWGPALRLLDEAQERNSEWAAIYVNRALVFEQQGRYPAALEELERALELEPDSTRWLMARSRIRRAAGDPRGADQDLLAIRQRVPTDPEGWIMRGLARLPNSAEEALSDFQEAARWRSMRPVAWQNMAHVLSERLSRPTEAIEVLSKLLSEFPEFSQARAGRAVLYARAGDKLNALADVESLRESATTPQLDYQIGCVYALLAVDHPELVEDSLRYLSRALQPSYGGQVFAQDSDLSALKEHEGFQVLRQAVELMNRYLQTPRN